MLSLRSQSWDIAQYPEIENQSNCAIIGGSRLAYTNIPFYIMTLKYASPFLVLDDTGLISVRL